MVLSENAVLLFVVRSLAFGLVDVCIHLRGIEDALLSFIYVAVSLTLFDLGVEASVLQG